MPKHFDIPATAPGACSFAGNGIDWTAAAVTRSAINLLINMIVLSYALRFRIRVGEEETSNENLGLLRRTTAQSLYWLPEPIFGMALKTFPSFNGKAINDTVSRCWSLASRSSCQSSCQDGTFVDFSPVRWDHSELNQGVGKVAALKFRLEKVHAFKENNYFIMHHRFECKMYVPHKSVHLYQPALRQLKSYPSIGGSRCLS